MSSCLWVLQGLHTFLVKADVNYCVQIAQKVGGCYQNKEIKGHDSNETRPLQQNVLMHLHW